MTGLMMDYPLTLTHILERSAKIYSGREIASRVPDGSMQRYTYSDFHQRVHRLAHALKSLGALTGDRIGTLCWNSSPPWASYSRITNCRARKPRFSSHLLFANNMKNRVSYRPAEPGEMPSIRALLKLYPQQLAQKNLPGISSFIVATSGERIVGCCALQIYSKRMGEVRSLVVHPEFQDQRIASKLVELCKQRARERGVKELFAVTSETSFFGRAGFATFRREKIAMFFDVSRM